MSLFNTALDPTGRGPFPNTHPATARVACPWCGMGMPSTGWRGKTENQDKNKPQVSASFPCNQPNEEMDGDGQAGVEKPPAAICGSSSDLHWEMDGQERSDLQKRLASPCKWVCSSFYIYLCVNCHLIANYFYLLAIISDFCNCAFMWMESKVSQPLGALGAVLEEQLLVIFLIFRVD